MQECVICGKEDPSYPILDYATGFYFCDDCWRKTGEAFGKYKEKTFSNWLRAVADMRDKYGKEKTIKIIKAQELGPGLEKYLT